MTSRTTSGTLARRRPRPVQDAIERLGGVAQVGLQDDPGARRGRELGLGEQLEDELEHGLARVQRLHVDVQVGAEARGAAQQLAQARRGVALAALGRLGAQQRRQRRDLDGQVRARQRAVPSRSSRGRSSRRRVGRRERVERLGAARGVAVGLGGGDRRLAEQVDGGGDAVAPQAAQRRQRVGGIGADDEAVRHVLDAGGPGGAEGARGRPSCCPSASPRCSGGGWSPTSSRKPVRCVARSSSERQAGTTSTKRNSAARSSASRDGEVHRALVERLDRMTAARGEGVGELAADALDLALERPMPAR